MSEMFDFAGWATKNDLKCSDGRVIRRDAFKHCDGQRVPLVWNHCHSDPLNVLGYAILENRPEGVYTYGKFNDTEAGVNAKQLVVHGDIVGLSIYANQLKQNGPDVLHGAIREVSLVLAGANPGAYIESVLAHGEELEDSGICSFVGADDNDCLVVVHSDDVAEFESEGQPEQDGANEENKENEMEHSDMAESEKTVQDVFDTLNEEQKTVVYAIIGQALEDAKTENKGDNMKHNVFDNDEQNKENVLSHSEIESIFNDAKRTGSLKDSILAHGIEDIDWLFPEANNLNKTPEFIKRPDDWVSKVMGGVHHTPFSRIKSMFADITEPEARARGYIKGHRKVEEVFGLLKRTTTPTTIYKKQKLDRDDISDITDFDVVAWLKGEMRMMLDEEIARAILVSDGRNAASDDKINEQNVRPIWTDDDLFTIKKTVVVPSGASDDQKAKAFIRASIKVRKDYRGSGTPALYCTEDTLTDCLLLEDGVGRVIYDTVDKLKTAIRVSDIITVPVMENLTRTTADGKTLALMGLIVNLNDYNIGADKGGAISMFDDFDIDYNQQKYLIETRISGALTKPFSAIALELAYGLMLEVNPEEQTETVLGKQVSAIQYPDVLVHDDFITGTLKYVTGWTQFDATNPDGNFLALAFEATEGATTVINYGSRTVTLDDDMQLVIHVLNKNTKLKVTTTKGSDSVTKTYSLSALKLEEAE